MSSFWVALGESTRDEALDAHACPRWLPFLIAGVDAPPLLIVRCVVKHHLSEKAGTSESASQQVAGYLM